jgi:excisionase family DNA binding protein
MSHEKHRQNIGETPARRVQVLLDAEPRGDTRGEIPTGVVTVEPNTHHSQSEPSDLPFYLTIDEWREIVRVGRSAAYDAVRTGQVPHIRVGRQIRIPRSAVAA